ncbi:hypothetical protein [Hydrogenophaga sp.]|uniref:hypothetical protein n=1 Tax=Hydrogenophaga sp. TaxID=1904254 RepID=UPI003F701DB4
MRKVLGAVVAGLVAGGVMLWLLEPYKARFPGEWAAIFDLAWAPMPLPRLVVAIAVLAIGFLLLEYAVSGRENKTQQAGQGKAKAVASGPSKLEPSFDAPSDQKMDRMSLTDDEQTVLSSLAGFATSVDADKLQRNTGLNERRFENALGNLRIRSFIDDVPLDERRSIALKEDGRRYAIKHRLGQKLVA